ncbi:MAG TPA: DUF6551 family protein [Candidatus Binatus sp.]|nr:DUF6551 family protein [Candidatus Binatus sp.]
MSVITLPSIMEEKSWDEEVIACAECRVDETYQRRRVNSLVQEIGLHYNLVLAGYIVVNRRADGWLYIIDGQQRWLGAKKAAEPEMLARVFEGLTVDEEAEMYTALNNTKPLSALDKFKGDVAAGKPDAVTIHDIVVSFGAGIRGTDGFGRNNLNGIGALKEIHERGGEHDLKAVLTFIKVTLGEISKDTAPGAFLTATHWVLSRHREINVNRLSTRIRRAGLIAVTQAAMAIGHRSVTPTSYYIALLGEYNHGLPKANKIDPILRPQDFTKGEDDE